MEDSDDERSGLGSVDDGGDLQFQEEDDSVAAISNKGSPGPEPDVIQNQPHDEVVEVGDDSDDSTVPSPASATMDGDFDASINQGGEPVEKVENQPFDEAIDISDDESVKSESKKSPDPNMQSGMSQDNSALETPTHGMGMGSMGDPQDESTSSEDSSDDDEGGMEQGEAVFQGEAGGYDPAEFADLDVSEDIKSLFGYIGRYNPQKIELEPALHPFIPEFIPAVGDIDAFIKLPRPDGKTDNLGITVLDEPCLDQSDPAALELQLRHSSKSMSIGDAMVRSIENAEQNERSIRAWVTSIDDVHKKKPPQEVTYSKPMPDIESLMQVWPPQFEEELSRCSLPSKDLDMPLEDYARVVCAMFDIPVHGKLTESLHVLFTLYSEFKNNDHFRTEMDAGMNSMGQQDFGFTPMGGDMMPGGGFGDMGGGGGFHDTMGGLPGPMDLAVGGSALSPLAPQDQYSHEVAAMGDEINPPPVTFHQRVGGGAQGVNLMD